MTPHRRLFLLSATSLLLAGCGDVLGPPPPSQIYVLRPSPPRAASGVKAGWALAVARPDASELLDSERIALARSATRFDYYANAVWPDRLPNLIQTALLAGFEASGRIDAVAREGDAVHADYELLTDLRDFEARYASLDAAPTVDVTLIAHMAGAHSRKIVASLSASFAEPAAANNVDAVVEAFDTALAKAVAQIVDWALLLPPPSPA